MATKSTKLVQPLEKSYRNLFVVFSVLAVVLVIIILYFTLSKATVVVNPRFQMQEVGFSLQVVDQAKAAETATEGKLIGQLKELTVENTKEVSVIKSEKPSGQASGTITIHNDYSISQPLVATTRFQTESGLVYRISQGVIVPANGKIEAVVTADAEGENYAIGPSKFLLPGLSEWKRQYVYAESSEPFKMSVLSDSTVTQEQIDKSLAELKIEMLIKAKTSLGQGLPQGYSLIDQLIRAETIKQSSDKPAGDQAEKFKVSLTLNIKGLLINYEELKRLATNSLPENYNDTQNFLEIDQQSFTVEPTFLGTNNENLLATINGHYQLKIAKIEIEKDKLKGLSKSQAEAYLKAQSGIGEFQIKLPFWSKYFPALEDNINVEIVQ